MTTSRRSTNGRSPLVNQQRQITTFFTKAASSPSPSPALSKISPNSKPNPNPSSNPNPNPSAKAAPAPLHSVSPSSSPTTPSPIQTKRKKPLLVIGQSLPSQAPVSDSTKDSKKYLGEEVVNKRVRVYWPLDQSWYEGCVRSFDKTSGKHLVQYDDGEEESLDIGKEKIEWVEEPVRKFRRLRRASVVEDEEEENVEELKSIDDDSEDEDWGKNAEKEESDEVSEEDMDLEDEDDDKVESVKVTPAETSEPRKRKNNATVEKLGSNKKNKSCLDGNKSAGKVSLDVSQSKTMEPSMNNGEIATPIAENTLLGDAAERFGTRDAEKFRFLGENRRDANRRRPGEENYDPKTLFLPPLFLKSLTGGQKQWWEFKSKHMDKVLFFKMGKFYELFEMDAHVGAKELDLQYMKGAQPHCGFPEKNFSTNVEKLARKGYRVLVVEQTETPEQLNLRRKEKGSKDKVVKREICAVVTKGTLTEGEMLSANPDASYLLALTESCHISPNKHERIFGVCVTDVATSKIILGQFVDDSECSGLSCLLSELRPAEIIKPLKQLSTETERVLTRYTRSPLVNELVPLLEFWNAEKTTKELMAMYRRINGQTKSSLGNEEISDASDSSGSINCLPNILSELVIACEDGMHALSALGGTLFYLKQVFLDEALLRFAEFELLPCSGFSDIMQKPYMTLDAASLENLEIFENNRNGDTSGTLYSQLNHCVTAFGKRLLKSWLARPLYHVGLIKERQDAVAGLKGANLPFVLECRRELSRLPDMERCLARIFSSSECNGRNAHNVVLYEDAAKKQLQEFISVLRGCEVMTNAFSSMGVILENVGSKLLHHLLTPGKGFPDVQSVLKHFKEAFDWAEANSTGRIIPREGVDTEYDSACTSVKEIEIGLENHLKKQQKVLGSKLIKYVTIGKDSYLLEVPESLCENIPQDYELQSSKKGVFRYWDPVIKASIRELSHAESEKESKLKSILQRLVVRFCEHHNKWRQLVSTTAELDVLMSLAIASDYYEGPTCRPVISALSGLNEVPSFSAKNLGHPVLTSDSLGKGNFVSNDVEIGGSSPSFILLTGPNMGGKSTLLRQVCLAVILAQVGAEVPAESFEMSPVDHIFVRMGAKDHIMAGQSTFLTELLETSKMLSSATRNSLVALDELGRGTSTSDGQAIAESVLEHFVEKVQCRGLFSTHYHRLSLDYQKDSKVSLCHMACHVGKGVGGLEEVTFLYKLTLGACPKSYGVNVARLAGLPDILLKKAAIKSQEFERMYGKHEKQLDDKINQDSDDNTLATLIQNFINLAAASANCHESEGILGSLNELQQRARFLLEQN